MKVRTFFTILLLILISNVKIFVQDTEYQFRYGTRVQKISAINSFMRQKTSRELELLIDSLKDNSEDMEIRKYIIHALRVFPHKKAMYSVIWALECDLPVLRKEAALVVSGYPLKEVMYPIINALSDYDYRVRKNALFSLARIGNKSIIAFIRRCLNDEHPDVRFQARMTFNTIIQRNR